MKQEMLVRSLVILVVVALSLWLYYPLNQKVSLGLDLSGGMDVVLEVDTDEVLNVAIEKNRKNLKSLFETNDIQNVDMQLGKDSTLVIKVPQNLSEEKKIAFESIINNNIESGKVINKVGSQQIMNSKELIIGFNLQYKAEDAVSKAIEVIRNRIDYMGVKEPVIKQEGDRNIRIQLPGVVNPEEARNIIGKTAVLKFHLVKRSAYPGEKIDEENEVMLKTIPIENRQSGKIERLWMVLDKNVELGGDTLSDAKVWFDQFRNPEVLLNFNSRGAELFAKITEEHIGKQLAIVLDDTIQSFPTIQNAIYQGNARITGKYQMEEAKRLAIILRSGAMPAPVKIIEERTVGPTLGADSIKKGITSIIMGFFAVVIYITFRYKFFGLVANFALLLNMILMFGALALLQATLTLPGIAGIILTVGIAVDANVIIFERIREELREGKTVRASIEAGFRKAWSSIIDANVTTLLTALILYYLGTGPIKGFAVTLTIGILASMFTALFCVKTVLMILLSGRKWNNVHI